MSDWPDCRLEVRCPACDRSSLYPAAMLRWEIGDKTFGAVIDKLRCGACGARPAPVYLLAGQHREFCYGSPPGWAIELVPEKP